MKQLGIPRALWISSAGLCLFTALLVSVLLLLLRSDSFVHSYLLPNISELAGIKITATRTRINLLNEIEVEGLEIGCNPRERSCYLASPLAISATKLRVKYNLWGLINRKLHINSISADGVHVSIAQAADNSNRKSNIHQAAFDPNSIPENGTPSVSSKPKFTITAENVTIQNGSFRYLDSAASAAYLADNISLSIPKADSNGDSELQLQTRITAETKALSAHDELLSGSFILRDAALFVPRQVSISARAGARIPSALELDASLNLSELDNSFKSIKIDRAILRQALFEALSIKSEQLTGAEYELKGTYTFNQPAGIRFALRVNRAITKSAADLRGSELSASLVMQKRSLIVEQSLIELIANNSRLAKGTLSGEFGFDPFKTPSKLALQFSEANFDGIEQLFNLGKPRENGLALDHAGNPEQNSTGNQASLVKLPLIEASFKVDKAIYQKLGISDLIAELTTTDAQTIKHGALAATFDGAGKLSASLTGSLNSTVNIRANGDRVNILPLAALAQGSDQLLEGTIDRLNLDLSFAPHDPRATISGRSELLVSRVIVPSTLHGQVPFNILFLPFDALITVFGGTLNAVLPKSVSDISVGIRQVLDDAGRLGIAKGVIDLDFNQGKITCKKFDIDTKNLPDFTVKGGVTPSDKLDFTIFIGLLKLNLPLPVAGTLSAPLPDVVMLGPEIIRGLGLSIGNIASGVVSMVGAGSQGEPPK